MVSTRYKAEALIEFAVAVLTSEKIGFPKNQAQAAANVLVEADLRGDPAHGLAGGSSLDDILVKVNDDFQKLGFKRVDVANYSIDEQKYPTILTIDAHGTLGHYVAVDIISKIVEIAKKFGMAKSYIRNSTHFGDCAIYSEIIAEQGLAAKVSCTSPQWTKPFIERQLNPADDQTRYKGVTKRFGTNPIAWSIPYKGGIITIDLAATQRAVSPALDVAKDNKQALGIYEDEEGRLYIGVGDKRRELTKELHLHLARLDEFGIQKELENLGYQGKIELSTIQEGLLKGPNGENINYPLAFDPLFKEDLWIAPLGGDYFGYKGFGLNMLIELDNVIGGGSPELIRKLDGNGKPTTPERVSQTIEAYAIDILQNSDVGERLLQSIETTRKAGNSSRGFMWLPGQKERETRVEYLKTGIPYTDSQIEKLKDIGEKVGVAFNLIPIK